MKILSRTIYYRDRRKGRSEGDRSSPALAVLLLLGGLFIAVLIYTYSPAAADEGAAPPSDETVSETSPSSPLPASENETDEFPAELHRPSIYSDARDTRIYHPAESVPSRLGERFMALIPPADRASVDWQADDQERTLTLTAPPQIIATADQLIPRMDANVQLSGEGVEYGVAEPTLPSTAEEAEPAPSAGAYYDPNENRMVETRWENENAIFPVTEEEMGTRIFGGDDAQAPNEVSPQTADVAVYSCPSEKIGLVAAGLKAKYKESPGVMITSDADDEIILVYAPTALQEQIRRELASVNIEPAAPERRDTTRSLAAPNRESAPAESGAPFRIGYSPVYKSLDALESQLTALFKDRITQTFPAPGQENLTPAEKERRVWRFEKKMKDSAAPAPACDISFIPSAQTILMVGSRSVCEQMRKLIETMDQEGRSRQTPYYIQIRNADSKKIESIFRMQNEAVRGRNGSAPISLAAPPKREISTAEYTAGASDEAPIRQTALQDESGEAASSGGDDLNMVSDFVPTVLPDLDIVIVDAPPAEAKRITDMIAKIEELAAKANPSIEMYQLKYVNSLTLGGILQRLYTEMFLTKQGRVLAYPMQTPNAILLVGWGKALESMKDLIRTFDQPIESEGSDLHVVFLKHQSARSMAALLTESFPSAAAGTAGMAPRIRVIADDPTNSLVIQASSNDFEEIQRLLMELDVNRSNVKLEVRTFPLKNTLAEHLRLTITSAITPAAAGTAGRSTNPTLEFLSVDAESRKLISSGIMKDVQITANPYKQQLIVTAPADCMELIAKLIEALDVPAPTGQLKIFAIRHGDATQMQKTLTSILATNPGGTPSIPNSKGETSFVPVHLTVDTRTNSILAAGSPGDLRLIDALITALDRKDSNDRQEEVIRLRTVRAASVASAINQYLNEKRSLELTSDTISDHQLFESQVIVIPEANTNSIILSATGNYMNDIKEMVDKLDREPQQVVIQVLIAEVTLTDQEQFGIQAGLQDKVAFDRSIVTNVVNSSSTIGNPGYDFITNNTQGNAYNSGTDPEYLAGQVLSNFGMGRSDSDLGYGGLILSASSRSVQVILRALRDKNRLQVLSRPQIQAMDNQQAFILVGQRVPRVSGASTTTYGVTSNVVDANVGLILLVTPRISQDGRVIMEIGAEKSSLGSSNDAIPVFSSEGQVITSPTINTTQLMTAVSAQDGETVMLGGMISSTKEKISRGVPYISDIPVLGWLFRFDSDTEMRKELLIVMTPRVVNDPADSASIKLAESRKMSWCLADAMAINGDMGLYNPLDTQGTPQGTRNIEFREMDNTEDLPSSTIRPKTSDSQKSENPSLKTARVSTDSSWFKK